MFSLIDSIINIMSKKSYNCIVCNDTFRGKKYKNLCDICYVDNYRKTCTVCKSTYYLNSYTHKYKYINGDYKTIPISERLYKCGLCAVNNKYIDNCICCDNDFIASPFNEKYCETCDKYYKPYYNVLDFPNDKKISKSYALKIQFDIYNLNHEDECPYLVNHNETNEDKYQEQEQYQFNNNVSNKVVSYYPILSDNLGLYEFDSDNINIIDTEYDYDQIKCLSCKPIVYKATQAYLIKL